MGKTILNREKCLMCGSSQKPLFKFPSDINRLSLWLKLIKKEDFLQMSPTYIYSNGRLCAQHFQDKNFTSTLKMKLTKFAIPYLEENIQQNQLNDSLNPISKNILFLPESNCNPVEKNNLASSQTFKESSVASESSSGIATTVLKAYDKDSSLKSDTLPLNKDSEDSTLIPNISFLKTEVTSVQINSENNLSVIDCSSSKTDTVSSSNIAEKDSIITGVSSSKFDAMSLNKDSEKAPEASKTVESFATPEIVKQPVTVITLCCTNGKEGVAFQKFLQDPKQRMHWISSVKGENLRPSHISVLCPEHYCEDELNPSLTLKENTVPNIASQDSVSLQKDAFQKWKEVIPVDQQEVIATNGITELSCDPKEMDKFYVKVMLDKSIKSVAKKMHSQWKRTVSDNHTILPTCDAKKARKDPEVDTRQGLIKHTVDSSNISNRDTSTHLPQTVKKRLVYRIRKRLKHTNGFKTVHYPYFEVHKKGIKRISNANNAGKVDHASSSNDINKHSSIDSTNKGMGAPTRSETIDPVSSPSDIKSVKTTDSSSKIEQNLPNSAVKNVIDPVSFSSGVKKNKTLYSSNNSNAKEKNVTHLSDSQNKEKIDAVSFSRGIVAEKRDLVDSNEINSTGEIESVESINNTVDDEIDSNNSNSKLDPVFLPKIVNTSSVIDPVYLPKIVNASSVIAPVPLPKIVNASSVIAPVPLPKIVNAPSVIAPVPLPKIVNVSSGIDPEFLPKIVNATSGIDPEFLPKIVNASSGIDPEFLPKIVNASSGIDPAFLPKIVNASSGIDPVDSQKIEETKKEKSSKLVETIKLPNKWWAITRTPQYCICWKWNECYEPIFRVVIDKEFNVKLFIKGRRCIKKEGSIICIENISSFLQEVDTYEICAGIDDRAMTSCLGHLEKNPGGPFSIWCKGCQRKGKELMNSYKSMQ